MEEADTVSVLYLLQPTNTGWLCGSWPPKLTLKLGPQYIEMWGAFKRCYPPPKECMAFGGGSFIHWAGLTPGHA